MSRIESAGERLRLKQLARDFDAYIRTAIKAAVARTVADAKATTLFKDGPRKMLRRSIQAAPSIVSPYQGAAIATAPHAVFVENGTRPHVIRPKNAKRLVFQVNGAWVSAKQVQHPGTKATHFMKLAGEAADFPRHAAHVTRVAIERHNG